MAIPQVTLKDAHQFSNVWRHKGVAIPMQDIHLRFAADFANVALKSFIETAQRQAAAKAAEAAKPKVVLTGE